MTVIRFLWNFFLLVYLWCHCDICDNGSHDNDILCFGPTLSSKAQLALSSSWLWVVDNSKFLLEGDALSGSCLVELSRCLTLFGGWSGFNACVGLVSIVKRGALLISPDETWWWATQGSCWLVVSLFTTRPAWWSPSLGARRPAWCWWSGCSLCSLVTRAIGSWAGLLLRLPLNSKLAWDEKLKEIPQFTENKISRPQNLNLSSQSIHILNGIIQKVTKT